MSNGAIGDVIGVVESLALPAAVGPWGFVLEHWKLITGGIGLMLIGFYVGSLKIELAHTADQLKVETANHRADIETVKSTTAEAKAEDAAHSLATVNRNLAITKDTQDDLNQEIADARTAVAGFARLHPARAAESGGGSPPMPAARDPASETHIASGDAIVHADDLRICADNTVKARRWPKWYQRTSEGLPEDPD